ncbi:hypothetical protein [Paraburkholderia hospita]|uniref:hypothetical protein n=1 Tax=Paraburkholderia TaxID=1822464 RepID=UPI0010547A65|nr:hypothetical protein [Paraburkholderia hospita]
MDLNIELVSRVEELLNDMTDDQVRQEEAAIPETERYRWGFPQVAAIPGTRRTSGLSGVPG